MNKRTIFIMLLVVIGAGAIYYFAANKPLAQPAVKGKKFLIGVMTNPPSLDPAWEGFREGMKNRGHEEGKNIRYIVKPVGKDVAATKPLIDELIADKVDLIYVMGVIAARAAKERTAEKKPDLPVIFGVVSNPVGGKLVESMQSSGNNLTGISPINEIVVSKRLEVFLDMIPTIKRVIFAWNDPHTTGVENLRNAAKTLGVELIEKQVANSTELEAYLAAFPFRPDDGLLRATDAVSATILKKMIALSIEKKIPLSGTNVNDAELGALMSYGANYNKIGQQAARLAESILKGTKPADLPIELPEEFEFVINARTAEALGLTIPSAVLSKANRIIR